MQEITYDIDKKSIEKPFGDEETIVAIINAYINAEESLFNIVYKNNKEKFNKDNLVFKDLVQGVLQLKSVSLSANNDGTELKEISINVMIPLNKDNKKYNDAITTLIKNVNNQQFEVDDSITITLMDMQIMDANKLSKPINGIEYELVIISGRAVTSKQYIQAVDQYLKIDDKELAGTFNISYTCLKSSDGYVLGLSSPIQKNATNGVQVGIEVDLQFYKNDPLHMELLVNAEKEKVYTVEFFNGLFTKTYSMMLLQAVITGIKGDSIKGKISFVVGD